ncbi:hypothetical protein VTN02DRAFT_2329 [Thermoascus thermophilus]
MPEAAVVACVAAIISAYHDGTTLVSRTKERHEGRRTRALPDGPTEALEDSLTLGPLIVQREYDDHHRRCGPRYAHGDPIAREQLKDVLITLQSALLRNLRRLWQHDDAEPDLAALHAASDRCRIDAVVALCQLEQRLAAAAPTLNTSIAPSDSVGRRSSVEPQSPRTRERRSSSTGSTRRPFSLRGRRSPRLQSESAEADSTTTHGESSSPWTQPDPDEDMAMIVPRPLRIPRKQPGWPDPSSSSSSSSSSDPNPIPITVIPMALYLPSEANNFAGFCKGAWKLQRGLIHKAFSDEIRPEGMYSTVPIWRCSKCHYEGPMMTISSSSSSSASSGSSGSKSKSKSNSTRRTKTFDIRVRVHPPTGIRYRWAFLAKSHLPTGRFLALKAKTGPGSGPRNDGSAGSFGCIFCCAERRSAAPTFGHLDRFMEHLLLQHRSMLSMPEAMVEALRARTRCVVGRVARDEEDFDVNLPPVG